MDIITAPYSASSSDESSCSDSSGPITPINSPFVHPLMVKGGVEPSLDHLLDFDKNLSRMDFEKADERQSYTPKTLASACSTVCFIGAGYVGGPTAAMLALHNPEVRVEVVDKSEERIRSWKSRHLPIHEPGLGEVVRLCRDGAKACRSLDGYGRQQSTWERQPNLFFTADVSGSISRADIIFLAVNTSTKSFGLGAGRATDMTACDAATREIARHAKPGTIIVEKSTVPCGTAKRIASILSSSRPDTHFEILSNPEFLAEGSAIEDLMNPDRVIIGSFSTATGQAATECLADLYGAWVPRNRILTCNVWSSELSKLVANAMLAQRISSINSISPICEATGADVQEIAKSVGQDTRIGSKFLKAGLGFGGSCFKKDICSLIYLAETLGLDEVAEYWSHVNRMNEYQHRRFTRKIIRCLDGNLVGKKIAILGFAFKANTGDCRQSVTAEVIKDLMEERPAEISIYDPYCQKADILRELRSCQSEGHSVVSVAADVYEACGQADAVLIATDCEQFKSHSLRSAVPHKEPVPDVPAQREILMVDDCGINVMYSLSAEPCCPQQCPSCVKSSETATQAMKVQDQGVDWSQILAHLNTPRRIFDGRNVIDESEIKSYGISVTLECIGRRS